MSCVYNSHFTGQEWKQFDSGPSRHPWGGHLPRRARPHLPFMARYDHVGEVARSRPAARLERRPRQSGHLHTGGPRVVSTQGQAGTHGGGTCRDEPDPIFRSWHGRIMSERSRGRDRPRGSSAGRGRVDTSTLADRECGRAARPRQTRRRRPSASSVTAPSRMLYEI
jgi:hypothetical protein